MDCSYNCRSHSYSSQLRKLTGLSEAGEILADSLGIHGRHTDRVFGVRGKLGEQDGCFLPTNLGLVKKKIYVSFLGIGLMKYDDECKTSH